MSTEKNEAQAKTVAADMPVQILAQYVRDMSFENPGAPQSLRAGLKPPQMDINIGMDARQISDKDIKNMYEVVLNVQAKALRGEENVFLAEILYGIVVSIDAKVPADNHHPLLLIEIPRLAFPFVRQLLSDLTIQGGFPPLLLNPVNFHELYMQQFGEEIRKTQEEAG